jgi:hypothetical protein
LSGTRSRVQALTSWKEKRERVEAALADNGLRYFRLGRVLPQGDVPFHGADTSRQPTSPLSEKPGKVEELLEIVVHGLRRAMHPLTHRRKGAQPLSFTNEYDVQDLLHAMLRPSISDIRPEEFTPSYAGSSTRMDFLLPAYSLVIETKLVRDRTHAKRIGDELIVDIEHYRRHPGCKRLWCVVYDPDHLITNADGLRVDLEGHRSSKDGEVVVKVFVLWPRAALLTALWPKVTPYSSRAGRNCQEQNRRLLEVTDGIRASRGWWIHRRVRGDPVAGGME